MKTKTHTHTHLTPIVDEGFHGLFDGRVWGLTALHLGLKVVFKVRPHHEVVLPPFIHCDLGFGLYHCVDSSNCRLTHSESKSDDRFTSVDLLSNSDKMNAVFFIGLNDVEIDLLISTHLDKTTYLANYSACPGKIFILVAGVQMDYQTSDSAGIMRILVSLRTFPPYRFSGLTGLC